MRRFILMLCVGSAGAIAIGCTSTVTLRNDELSRLMNQPRIRTAVLTTGGRIQFDELGAELNPSRQTVTGITRRGDSVNLPYGDVYYLQVASEDSSEGVTRDLGPRTLEPEFTPKYGGPIARAILASGDTIAYDQIGATVDFRLKTMNGKSNDGGMVSCDLAEVESVRLKARFDPAKTALLTGGITVFVVLYALSQAEWSYEPN